MLVITFQICCRIGLQNISLDMSLISLDIVTYNYYIGEYLHAFHQFVILKNDRQLKSYHLICIFFYYPELQYVSTKWIKTHLIRSIIL